MKKYVNMISWGKSKMEFNDVIKKRRITREFSNKEVEYKDIEAIIEAGTLAPTCIIGVGYPSKNAYYLQEVEYDKNRIHRNRW